MLPDDLESNQDGPPELKLNEPEIERSDNRPNSPPTLSIISPPSLDTNANDKPGMFFLFDIIF